MYYRDLEACGYWDDSVTGSWNCLLIAIGWLEGGREFSKGEAPSWLAPKVREYRELTHLLFPLNSYLGEHSCTLCDHGLLEGSSVNLFIPATDRVFAVPGAVGHYIEAHGYVPPVEFLRAFEACPQPGSDLYLKELARVNGGPPPLVYSPPSG